ncbi:branched-chain amino acid ABC transporter permease [Ideonella sp. A 288]|uniref:branched-chain amino acid ABC transporter permease n=1 Tax=Ideonella sp. A 288 TaxID=1962181 RepID=UPI000B4B6436|nr:branched-chain amino acid ABC transporter permease [Ideonella sp. A 288]
MSVVSTGRGHLIPWAVAAAVVVVLPFVFSSGSAITMMSLMGFGILFALSYNMLLGQTGMLSFGHAVYYGLGGFMTAHALNVIAAGKWPIPLPVVPLVGGLAGLFFAFIFGWVSTKRAGTAFSMISLGIGELVAACSLILRGFFGGEGGVSTSRTSTLRLFDISFGPQVQVYYLIAAWCLLCTAAMYAFTRTPLGRMCNAVRDNPERAEFVGYSTQVVRFIVFCVSGFFAGVAGGLAAIHYEIVTASVVGAVPSGFVLLMTYIGGIAFFIGPIIGAVLMTALQISLSDYTGAWQLYVGLMFVVMVMYAPWGLAGLLLMHQPLVAGGTMGRVLPAYAKVAVPSLMLAAGVVLLIETSHHLLVKAAEGPAMRMFGIDYAANSAGVWVAIPVLIVLGGLGLKRLAPGASAAFHAASLEARSRRPA